MFNNLQLSNEKNPGWLGYIGDEILPNYIGIIIGQNYKDPYKPTCIMKSNKVFFFVAQLNAKFFCFGRRFLL